MKLIFKIIPITVFFSATTLQAASCLADLEWVKRKEGNFQDIENPELGLYLALKLPPQKLTRTKIFDAAYGRDIEVKGYKFADIAQQNGFSSVGNLALLHFENAMVIPFPLNDPAFLNQSNLFVACQFFVSGKEAHFPELRRPDPFYRDPHPIKFAGNKVVSSTLNHPMHPQFAKSKFSPWLHMNSLKFIEIVNEDSYYRQFSTKSAAAHKGFEVFKNRCQYCHGVKKIGARYGWDFAGPLPLHIKRDVDSLLNHVKYPKQNAFEIGTLMPHQKDIEMEEVKDVWQWARSLTTSSFLQPYQP